LLYFKALLQAPWDDAFQHHKEGPTIHGNTFCGTSGKAALLKTLIPDHKAIYIPVKDLHSISTAIKKDEISPAGGWLREEFLHHEAQAFKAFAQIHGMLMEEDAGISWQS
jgi:hypothetical protein